MSVQQGAVEVYLEYGGDFQLTSTGDLRLAIDGRDNGLATKQWLERLILTSPVLLDANGKPVARADDIVHPTWGGGLRQAVGQNITNALLSGIQSRIAKAIAANTRIATTPAPVITVTDLGNAFIEVYVSCTTTAGQPLVITQQLNVFGG